MSKLTFTEDAHVWHKDKFSDQIQIYLKQKIGLQLEYKSSKAYCLNQLRAQKIDFINLGNLVYCPTHKILLIFQAQQLYAYDLIGEFRRHVIQLIEQTM